jgi:hypothetical protein
VERLRWLLAAAIAALACHLAVQPTTPIDLALPFLALLVTLLAWASYPPAMIAVPLLIAAELALPDETMRLFAFGAVMAAVVGVAMRGREDLSPLPTAMNLRRGEGTHSFLRSRSAPPAGAPLIAVAAILLLRWIPLHDVLIGRELFLLAVAVAIVLVLGRTPFAIMIAVIAALVTPAVPLRTLAFPLLVLAVATAARTFGMPALRLAWPSTIVVAFAVLFFAWSGVVARAFPYFLNQATAPKERIRVTQALAPSDSVTLDVPQGARSLIISGANVARLRGGAPLGRIEPGGLALRIGDAADWGCLRREQFHASRNPLPRDPAGTIRGYGYNAWLDGAGRVALPAGARQIRVIADAALPPNAALQVEGFE